MDSFGRKEARNWLWEQNTEPFHRQHGEIVGAVLGAFAAEYDPGREKYWQAVGPFTRFGF